MVGGSANFRGSWWGGGVNRKYHKKNSTVPAGFAGSVDGGWDER